MAGRQLKDLFSAFRAHDELAFRRVAQEIIDEEESKHHFALARDLKKIIAGSQSLDVSARTILPTPPKDREGDWELAEIREPNRQLDDLVLAEDVEHLFHRIAAEVIAWPQLVQAQVPRRQRLLLQGRPGCGKTTGAEALAGELGWPFVLVRLDSVVSSYLGETASNLRRVFDFASEYQVVILFDEFDSLGRMRDEIAEHGEMKRVVTAFLQMLDNYRGSSLLLAATNHPGLLDPALWRRFDEIITFPLPTVHELRKLLRIRLRPVGHAKIDIEAAASLLKGLPHAAAEKAIWDARRDVIIQGRTLVDDEDVRRSIAAVRRRPW